MTSKKKNREQANIGRNLKKKVKEYLKNVELRVKHFDTYSRWKKLSILVSKTKDQFQEPLLQKAFVLVA
jgi:hypothetical protein